VLVPRPRVNLVLYDGPRPTLVSMRRRPG